MSEKITAEMMRAASLQGLKEWYTGHKRDRKRLLFRAAVARASKPRKKR